MGRCSWGWLRWWGQWGGGRGGGGVGPLVGLRMRGCGVCEFWWGGWGWVGAVWVVIWRAGGRDIPAHLLRMVVVALPLTHQKGPRRGILRAQEEEGEGGDSPDPTSSHPSSTTSPPLPLSS